MHQFKFNVTQKYLHYICCCRNKPSAALCPSLARCARHQMSYVTCMLVKPSTEAAWPVLARVRGNSELKTETGSWGCNRRPAAEKRKWREWKKERETERKTEPHQYTGLSVPEYDHGESIQLFRLLLFLEISLELSHTLLSRCHSANRKLALFTSSMSLEWVEHYGKKDAWNLPVLSSAVWFVERWGGWSQHTAAK